MELISIKNNGELPQSNYQRAKELFPAQQATGVVNNNNINTGGHIEKPEIPPLPKQLLQQQQQQLQQPQQQQQLQTQQEGNTIQISGQHPPISAKPVPMTRTQFFGLDNLPSPTADRKSNDSVSSLTFKPDLPQKPKIPKRPMILGLTTNTSVGGSANTAGGDGANVSGNRSGDEDSTPTSNTNETQTVGNATLLRGHKTAEQLVQEHCDNVTALQANIGSSNTSIPSALLKETNHNNHFQFNNHANLEINANAVLPPPTIPPPPAVTVAKVMTSNVNSNLLSTVSSTTATTATMVASSASNTNTDKPLTEIRLATPTTPVSPNMIMTPKRPTVPAPPPPTNIKKQVE